MTPPTLSDESARGSVRVAYLSALTHTKPLGRRLAVAIVGIVTLGMFDGCGGAPQAVVVMTPAVFVASSAQATLNRKTADVTLQFYGTEAGQDFVLQGSGQADLATAALAVTLTGDMGGQAVTLNELVIDRKAYMGMQIGNESMVELTGHNWVEVPTNALAGLAVGHSNPLISLAVLKARGATVQVLGVTHVDGAKATGYEVIPSRAAMAAFAKQALARSGLSSSHVQAIEREVRLSQPPTISAWFNSSHLLCRVELDTDLQVGATENIGTMIIDFTHFGAPVSIYPPLPGDVVSYQKFQQVISEHAAQ